MEGNRRNPIRVAIKKIKGKKERKINNKEMEKMMMMEKGKEGCTRGIII